MSLLLIEPPAGPVFNVDQLKEICEEDTNELVETMKALEAAAVAYLDGHSGRLGKCVLRQRWAAPVAATGTAYISFPDATEMEVIRLNGTTWETVPDVEVLGTAPDVCLDPLPDDVEGLFVGFYSGWATAADVPADIQQIIRFLVRHWYDGHPDIPPAAEALIAARSVIIA